MRYENCVVTIQANGLFKLRRYGLLPAHGRGGGERGEGREREGGKRGHGNGEKIRVGENGEGGVLA